jgi:hypothetical protein
MIKRFVFAVAWGVLVSCTNVTIENPTDQFLAGKKLSKLNNNKLKEISGGAASIQNPGFFWLHNDSGNSPELYLVNEDLKIVTTCALPVENRDWEDMAVGPGPKPGLKYIYLAEIGDNESRFPVKYIYRFEEPKWDSISLNITVSKIDTISFRLEGRNKDTETLLVDPASKDLYVISKRDDPVWLYVLKYPYPTDTLAEAKKVFSLPFTQIVSGDISPDGKKILLKNYEHVYYWENSGDLSIPQLLKAKPFEIPYDLEPQGETIMWAHDEAGFYTVSEKNVGKDTYFYFYKRRGGAR